MLQLSDWTLERNFTLRYAFGKYSVVYLCLVDILKH